MADEASQTEKKHYYPLSGIVMTVWLAYIAVMIWLLQHSASIATERVHQPWYFDWLPSVLLTGFAQGHLPVTAMYLARLGLSALHNASTVPRSWAELFWLADRRWQSPMGVGTTLIDKHKIKTQLSSTFTLFAITCLIALPTPIIVSRAWPVFTVWVAEDSSITIDTFAPANLANIEYASQIGTGEGAWATGMFVSEVYSSSTYTPRSLYGNDYFFAGDVEGEDVVLPGVRVQGTCAVSDPNVTAPADFSSFTNWCSTQINVESYSGLNFQDRDNMAEWWWCTTYDVRDSGWINTSPSSNVTALIWFNTTNGQTSLGGYIQCDSSFATGTAVIHGQSLTYTDFYEVPYYNTSEETSATGTTLLHPLFAALFDISQPFSTAANQSDERAVTLMKALGYQAQYNPSTGTIQYTQPTLETVATQLWSGTAHMAASIAVLARASNQTYPSILYESVSGRVFRIPFIAGSAFLIGAWLVMVIVCTLRMWGPTFGNSLDNYVAARMLAERRDLYEGQNFGEMARNKRLTGVFDPVNEKINAESEGKRNTSAVESSGTAIRTTFLPSQLYQTQSPTAPIGVTPYLPTAYSP